MSKAQVLEKTPQHFLKTWAESVEIVSAEKLTETTARTVWRFKVQPEYFNPAGTLHGGAQAAFLDVCTSFTLLLVSKPGFWTTNGSTRTLNVTYLRPALDGDMVRLECEVCVPDHSQRLATKKLTIKIRSFMLASGWL